MSKRYHGVHRYMQQPGRRWARSSAELREWLGLPKKLPPDFEARVTRDGLEFWCRPKTKRGMEKRVFVRCPECAEVTWIEAGHLPQHIEARHP